MVDYALDQLFGSMNEETLQHVIAREIGDCAWKPLGRVAIISSRTTIGVAIIPAVFAICTGNEVLVKDREDNLVAAFFETLADGHGARAEQWEGESESQDLSKFDAVVAFGTDETLQDIQAQLAPGTRFIPYGPKCSMGYIAREALNDEAKARRLAGDVAHDLVLYEGEGCLSLHALFVESDGRISFDAFAQLLSAAIERANEAFPIHPSRTGDFVKRMNARDLAVFRGSLLASNDAATFVLERGTKEHPPSFLPRVLAVHEANNPQEMCAYVDLHHLPLEVCAVSGASNDITDGALAASANGIVHFGEMQAPKLNYPHGGRPRAVEFVRFVEREHP
jgi:hypothetical protein